MINKILSSTLPHTLSVTNSLSLWASQGMEHRANTLYSVLAGTYHLNGKGLSVHEQQHLCVPPVLFTHCIVCLLSLPLLSVLLYCMACY
ncbi:hypothetical protein XELAEV_18023983mg [Xenopus laevis]|uniref:Uncharacterized protein n=1 Tax=Xenopus laevis TaxID=8355 RepID=A0A974D5F2_XENLA|nr:hypothetical protein XELAEV_18023983mg [Xenopus laevis]